VFVGSAKGIDEEVNFCDLCEELAHDASLSDDDYAAVLRGMAARMYATTFDVLNGARLFDRVPPLSACGLLDRRDLL